MIKQELFKTLDQHHRQLNQVTSLSNLMANAGGLSKRPENELRACLSVITDISNDLLKNHKTFSESVTELCIVNNCVNGTSDTLPSFCRQTRRVSDCVNGNSPKVT